MPKETKLWTCGQVEQERKDEVWKNINGFNEKYKISNYGRVKTLKGYNKEFLQLNLDAYGYFAVSLSMCSKIKCKKVHRLVAEAFVPNPENKSTVNHKNGIKTDNRAINLEWSSIKENIKHGRDMGLINDSGSKNSRSKLTTYKVMEIRRLLSEGILTQEEIGLIFKVKRQIVGNILNNRRYKNER